MLVHSHAPGGSVVLQRRCAAKAAWVTSAFSCRPVPQAGVTTDSNNTGHCRPSCPGCS